MSASRTKTVRVFVDTNVDASILLIENLGTTIGNLKKRVDELIRVNYDVPENGGVENKNTLERINCLFDAVSPSRERGNCFTVPDEYTVGDIAQSDILKLFAEYAVPVVRQKQNPYVTPVRKGRKQSVQKKERVVEDKGQTLKKTPVQEVQTLKKNNIAPTEIQIKKKKQ
eukprot:jgi/Picre1/29478/NNA_004865.t1